MKLNNLQFEILQGALQSMTFDSIRIYNDYVFFSKREKITFSVNWAALGDTAPAEAIEYANDIIQAAKVADALNSLNISIDGESTEKITRNEYIRKVDLLAAVLNTADVDEIKEAL